jgi:hypothetical protein
LPLFGMFADTFSSVGADAGVPICAKWKESGFWLSIQHAQSKVVCFSGGNVLECKAKGCLGCA